MHDTTSQDAPSVVRLAESTLPGPTGGGTARRPRLLIVEDDPSTGDVLGRFFRRPGRDVPLSMTVEGGLSLVSMHPDCAILDLNLPGGDGDAVLVAIREAGLATPVVVATGTTDQHLLERVERLSPERLLRKPAVFEDILRALGIAG